MSEFEGKVAIVTGSSSGIGAECAARLSALGATVVVNSASSVEAGEAVSAALPGPSSYIRADISDKEQCQSLIDGTLEAHGQLDFLINNAGWTTVVPHGDLDALDDEIFRKTFDVNVFGTWWLTKMAMPHLKQSENPNVVMVTSIAGVRPTGSSIAYAMTKAALNHLTILLAKSHAPVRVNAIAPGLVATPWTADWDTIHSYVASTNPIPRSATPDDCAETMLGMLRNNYMTGQVIVVDGGMSLIS